MGVFSGPDLKEDGLVLYLDTGNYKNSRSSVSTNLVSNGSFANGVGSPNESGSNPTNTIVQLENPGETSFVLRQNGNNTEYQLNISGLTASTTYVMSGWYAKSSDYNASDTMFHARTFSSSGAHIATGVDTGTLLRSITLGSTTWEYRYQTITTPSDSTGYMEWYVGYGTNNTTGYRYYTNLKIEKGTFPSLLNMVGDSNHGTPTNGLSYNSTNGGSLVFDGTDDYVTSTFSTTSGQAVTYCGWLYSTETTSTYRNFVDSVTVRPMIWWNTSGQIEFDAAYYTTTSVYRNQWVYIALSKPSGNSSASYYVNGVLAGTGTAYTTPTVTPTWFNRAGAQTWKGNCALVQIYNRALTAAEIQQNFNANRARFGI